jgi:cell division protein FtsW
MIGGGRYSEALAGAIRASQATVSTTIRRHRPDYIIVLYMGLLMLFGLVVIYSIGPDLANVLNNSYGSNYANNYFFIKQSVSLLLSLAAFAVMALVPYRLITKHASKVLIIGLAACAVLAISGWVHLSIAHCSLGACRWFNFGILGSLQPAEILKLGILLFVAGFLGTKVAQGKVNNLHETLIPLAVITAIAMLFIVIFQKDLGTGVALISIVVSMLVVGGLSKKIILTILAGIIVVGIGFIIIAPHRIDRIATFIQGDNTSASDPGSYQVENAKIAIGTGGLFGLGIGNSFQATGYLPEAINDSVFAIIGEMFGLVGLIAVLAVFAALLMRFLQIMDHLVDVRLKLLAAGVFGWLGSHVILNVASMIGIIPLTGITLPFLSFGGTSMIFIAAAIGLIFQLSRYTVHSSRLKETTNENSSSRRGIGRSRYASRSGS